MVDKKPIKKSIFEKLVSLVILHHRTNSSTVNKHKVLLVDAIFKTRDELTCPVVLKLIDKFCPTSEFREFYERLLSSSTKSADQKTGRLEDTNVAQAKRAKIEGTPEKSKDTSENREAEKELEEELIAAKIKLHFTDDSMLLIAFISLLCLYSKLGLDSTNDGETRRPLVSALNSPFFALLADKCEKSASADIIVSRLFSLFGRSRQGFYIGDPALMYSIEQSESHKRSYAKAVAINCLLSRYLDQGKIRAAKILSENTRFPQKDLDLYEAAVNLHLRSKIDAYCKNYKMALQLASEAALSVPRSKESKVNQLQLEVLRLHSTLSLLSGREILEESKSLEEAQKAKERPEYYELFDYSTAGNTKMLMETLRKHKSVFEKDGIASLVYRLRESTARKSLQNIAAVYSRIKIADIAELLGSIGEADAEFMLVKAINEGSISGRIVGGVFEDAQAAQPLDHADLVGLIDAKIGECSKLSRAMANSMYFAQEAHERDRLKEAFDIEEILKEYL